MASAGARPRHKTGSRLFQVTKSVIFLAAICLLLSTPELAYGAQLLHPGADASPSTGVRPFFMRQDRCVPPPASSQSGCGQVGSAASMVGNLTSHGGLVMHSATSYVIFWLPSGYHFDTPLIDQNYPNASDQNYEALVVQFLRDLSNTAYYSIVQQYTDSSGAPGLVTSLGGSWTDTSPYPNSEGTRANPLQDSDLQTEVMKAMNANSWPAGNGSAFYVLTGHNVFGCAGSSCSYTSYCAYHSAFQAANGENVIYADIPDPGNVNAGSCLATATSGAVAPNGGAFADSAVNLIAHEEFEAVTDPFFDGWYYQDTDHEIADECVWRFGPLAGDGSNIALSGHRYLVQEMWSNKSGGCYLPPNVPTLPVVASYQVQPGGAGLTPPTFTYYSGGVLTNALLSMTPQTLSVDFGSIWNVTGTLAGSTPTERWQTGQPSGGVLRSAGTFSFAYYHQFLVNFGFGVVGGGSGYSAPSLTITQFGYQASVPVTLGAAQGTWADAQSRYNYTGLLAAPSHTERWMGQSASGTVGSTGSVNLQYYHQYLVPISYTGGDTGYSPPVLSYSSLGGAVSAPLEQQPQSLWLDAGSGYSATDPLPGSTTMERWFAPRGSGTVSSAGPIQLVYHHQYRLTISGGFAVATTPQSPAGDGFYDSGSSVSVSSVRVWNATALTREALVSFVLDGGSEQVLAIPIDESGKFSTPPIAFDRPHQLVFGSASQYLVGFRFTDALGSRTIVPSSLQIETYQPNYTLEVQGSKAWLDAGSTFVVKQLLWEEVDVKPLNEVVSVGAPQNVTIATRVYDAKLKVSDYLQIPISGASARIQLLNGTSITKTTGTDGTVSMASLPLGRFNATVSYLGASQAVSADVAVQHGEVEARLPASLPTFGAIAVCAALVALVAYAVVRRKRSHAGSVAYP